MYLMPAFYTHTSSLSVLPTNNFSLSAYISTSTLRNESSLLSELCFVAMKNTKFLLKVQQFFGEFLRVWITSIVNFLLNFTATL